MSFFSKLKSKLKGGKKDKVKDKKEGAVKAQEAGDVHILPVPGVSILSRLFIILQSSYNVL